MLTLTYAFELKWGPKRQYMLKELNTKKKCSPLPAHWLPQERAGRYTDVSTQWAVEARQCLQLGLPTEILIGGDSMPQTSCPGGTSSSDDSHENMTDYLTFNHTCVLIYTFLV